MESQRNAGPKGAESSGATTLEAATPEDVSFEPDAGSTSLFSRRQVGVMAGGGAFLLAGAAGAIAWARGNTGALGRQTSFGTVEIRKAERRPRLSAAGADAGAATGHSHGGSNSLEPGNHTWADVVLVELEVRNVQDFPILLSPGQLRLKVGPEHLGVTPFDTGRRSGPIAAGATERFAVSYLSPSSTNAFSAEFTDPWDQRIVPLELPTIRNRPAMEAKL